MDDRQGSSLDEREKAAADKCNGKRLWERLQFSSLYELYEILTMIKSRERRKVIIFQSYIESRYACFEKQDEINTNLKVVNY